MNEKIEQLERGIAELRNVELIIESIEDICNNDENFLISFKTTGTCFELVSTVNDNFEMNWSIDKMDKLAKLLKITMSLAE